MESNRSRYAQLQGKTIMSLHMKIFVQGPRHKFYSYRQVTVTLGKVFLLSQSSSCVGLSSEVVTYTYRL